MILEAKNLTKYYGTILALDNFSVQIKNKGVFGLLGLNGAGKTTFMSIITSLVKKTSGKLIIKNLDLDVHSEKIKSLIGFMPQDSSFYNFLTVEEHLEYFGRLQNLTRKELNNEIKKLLRLTELEHYKTTKVRKLSHGMRKRLGLAQALLGTPEIIILDEPTSGLDPKVAFEIRNLIRKLGKDSTIIISSHNLTEIKDLCEEICIIHKGKFIVQDKTKNLLKKNVDESFLELIKNKG